jgi:ABC-type transport system involved in multi-copper enzyme maturation permease subunit
MPIHDQSYRRYGGGRKSVGRAWTVIAWAGVMTMIRKRTFLALLVAAWVPFVGHVMQIYFSTNFPQMAILAPTAKTFRDFFNWQEIFVFLVTIYVGAGLIASDRRANALQIYLSKPLLRSEYIAGKAAVLFTFLLAVTWLPAILLLIVQVLFAGSLEFVQKNLFLFPAITVASVLEVSVATFTMLALSSLSKSPRYVAILYAGVVFFTASIYGVMYAITNDSSLAWLAVSTNVSQVTDVIFRLPPKFDTPWQVSLTVLFGLIALSISILERRVRGVEIVT